MLTKRIIPCLDINIGRVVKGVSFVNLYDAGDPTELAEYYNRAGADELVFLDITASSGNREIILDVVKSVSEKVFIPLTVGGGVRTLQDVRMLLHAGADKVSINTSAIQNPNLISESSNYFGSQCIVVAIDAKAVKCDSKFQSSIQTSTKFSQVSLDENSKWEVFTHGGRNPTGIDAVKWAKLMSKLGAGELLVTSMDQDGHKSGYDIQQLFEISSSVQIPVIASGGAGEYQHLFDAFKSGLADAVLAASIFHSKTHSISGAKQFLSELGIPIRPLEQMEESE